MTALSGWACEFGNSSKFEMQSRAEQSMRKTVHAKWSADKSWAYYWFIIGLAIVLGKSLAIQWNLSQSGYFRNMNDSDEAEKPFTSNIKER